MLMPPFPSAMALGGILELSGVNSYMKLNGAQLTATCDQEQVAPAMLYTDVEEKVYTSYPGIKQSSVTAVLANVYPSCAGVSSLDTPCASNTNPLYPPSFICQWAGPHGSVEMAPQIANATEELSPAGTSLGFRVSTVCRLPETAEEAGLKIGEKGMLNLTLHHFVKRSPGDTLLENGKPLPFVGPLGGNVLTFDIPHMPPPPPPSPPPPPPPPQTVLIDTSTTGEDASTYDKSVALCQKRGSNLCSYAKICPNGVGGAPASWTGGQQQSDQWIATKPFKSNSLSKEWAQIGFWNKGAQSGLQYTCSVLSGVGYPNYAGWGSGDSHIKFLACCA